METDTIFYLVLLAASLPIAYLIGRRCKSVFASRLLRYGSLIIAPLVAAILFTYSCQGNLIYGLHKCGPWEYDVTQGIQMALGLTFMAYALLGPVLIIVALVAEVRARSESDARD